MVNNEQKMFNELKILIVEDQIAWNNIFKEGINSVITQYCNLLSIEKAMCFNDAEKLVKYNGYDIILLDHSMPYEPRPNAHFAFHPVYPIGYKLIPAIKKMNSSALIIGTSIVKEELLQNQFPNIIIAKTDVIIEKNSTQLENDLEKAMQEYIRLRV